VCAYRRLATLLCVASSSPCRRVRPPGLLHRVRPARARRPADVSGVHVHACTRAQLACAPSDRSPRSLSPALLNPCHAKTIKPTQVGGGAACTSARQASAQSCFLFAHIAPKRPHDHADTHPDDPVLIIAPAAAHTRTTKSFPTFTTGAADAIALSRRYNCSLSPLAPPQPTSLAGAEDPPAPPSAEQDHRQRARLLSMDLDR
jgi:hypothetical protein